jgi:hypothetical protein
VAHSLPFWNVTKEEAMNEKKNMKRVGWLAAAAALILAGALSISGASKPEPKPQAKSTATVSATPDGSLGTAQADSDVFEMQLD